MMVFKKSISRRTFLRGTGAALALPMLDAMCPAFGSTLQTANNQARQAKRLSFFHVPNGIIMDRFTPSTVGKNFELTPILEPLSAFKDRMLVISGLANNEARKMTFEVAGGQPTAGRAFLTPAPPKKDAGT